MLALIGKTCSGKDTIKKELIKMGLKPIITYTTRPPRLKEIDGVSYHFITNEEFLEKEKQGFFAETTSYNVASGETWYYGTAMDDLSNDKVIIVNPDGLRKLNKIKSINMISFYLMVNDMTIMKRLSIRGDNYDEAERRLNADRIDFMNICEDVDFIFRNDIDRINPRMLSELIFSIYRKINEGGKSE